MCIIVMLPIAVEDLNDIVDYLVQFYTSTCPSSKN